MALFRLAMYGRVTGDPDIDPLPVLMSAGMRDISVLPQLLQCHWVSISMAPGM